MVITGSREVLFERIVYNDFMNSKLTTNLTDYKLTGTAVLIDKVVEYLADECFVD